MLDFEPRPHSPPRVTTRGVFVLGPSMSAPIRVIGLIDGFNLYHSLQAERSVKWLDLAKLLRNSLQHFATPVEIVAIHYFTALPFHLSNSDPARLHRHQLYLRALRAQRSPRIEIHLGQIRAQDIEIQTHAGKSRGRIWREKGTDIALAVKLFELAKMNSFDAAMIISGDADYVPLAKGFAQMYPQYPLRFAFPYQRTSKELMKVCPESFQLSQANYRASRFPDEILLPSGKKLHCPTEWLGQG